MQILCLQKQVIGCRAMSQYIADTIRRTIASYSGTSEAATAAAQQQKHPFKWCVKHEYIELNLISFLVISRK